jgi:hypothetical protein
VRLEVATVLEFGVLVLFAIPIIAWVVRHRKGSAFSNEELPSEGATKHRWWQP